MRLGYNTNGLAHHDPLEAIDLLAQIGYQSVALSIDHGLLNPYGDALSRKIDQMRDRLVTILHGISSRPLARLAEGFLKDEGKNEGANNAYANNQEILG